MSTHGTRPVVLDYIVDGVIDWSDEEALVVPRVGEGVIYRDGNRYRVTDVWHSHDKHGVMNARVVSVLLTAVTEADDVPRSLYPDYFR